MLHISECCKRKFSALEKVLIAVSVCAFTAVIVLFVLFIYYTTQVRKHIKVNESLKEPQICKTQTCLAQASRILRNMDVTVNPCTDFYKFTCGNFIKHEAIPKNFNRFNIYFDTQRVVGNQLKEAYLSENINDIQIMKNLKKFFRRCTTTDKFGILSYPYIRQIITKLGWPIIDKNWNALEESKFDWLEFEASLNLLGLPPVFIETGAKTDDKQPGTNYISLDCSNIVFDRNINANPKEHQFFKIYRGITLKMIKNLVFGKSVADADLDGIINFHLQVENVKSEYDTSTSNYEDVLKTISLKELQAQLGVGLIKYLRKILPETVKVNLNTKIATVSFDCLQNMASFLRSADKRSMANYMTWMVIKNLLWIMSDETRSLEFEMEQMRIGIEAPDGITILCMDFIDKTFSEVASAIYVQSYFPDSQRSSLRTHANLLFKQLRKTLRDGIPWMDEETRKEAILKGDRIKAIIGYKDADLDPKYLTRTFGGVNITSGNLIKNVQDMNRHMFLIRMKQRIVENKDCEVPTAHLVNAQYIAIFNTINIPAGVAQNMIFSYDQPMYMNFASIGFIIGHELAHAFDAAGRKYDSTGRLKKWWTEKSNMKFFEIAQCMINQYDHYKTDSGIAMNGTLTINENMADNAGSVLAYETMLKWDSRTQFAMKLPGLENYTTNQMFWIGIGNAWCDKLRPKYMDLFVRTNVHSVGQFRVTGTVSNSQAFSDDFSCDIGSPMNNPRKCILW